MKPMQGVLRIKWDNVYEIISAWRCSINGSMIIWVTLAGCLPLHLCWVYQPEHPWGYWASGPNPWKAPCVQDHVFQPYLQPRAPFQKSGAQNMCLQMPTCVIIICSSRTDRGETKPCIHGTSLPISQTFMERTVLSSPGVGVSLKALWLPHLLEVLQRWIPAASDRHLMSTVLCPAPRTSTIVSKCSPKGNLGYASVLSLGSLCSEHHSVSKWRWWEILPTTPLWK